MTEHIWETDVLGVPFQAHTLPLGTDAHGEVCATLVRDSRRPPRFESRPGSGWPHRAIARNTDVLYLHGWSDYFFQTELADFWHERGARFHALDLRDYGRSMRPDRAPGYVDNLTTYDEDIEAALTLMGHGEGTENPRRLVIVAHSTGGLTASLWAHRHPGRLDALILNSPWLEFQAGELGRGTLEPLLSLGARYDPRATLPGVDFGYYSRATSAAFEGEWAFDDRWRPERGFPVTVGWLRTILAGHTQVARGLSIDVPVLTLLSDSSTVTAGWNERMKHSDSVLVVSDIAQRALKLGPTVTVSRVAGALHDVFLSERSVRDHAYAQMDAWLRGF
ncbi:alpha/beta hydrolase [Mycetocola tolaasinivorans]|uniref:Alpha/beta hydrolase n=1 Tax=Mycetocola tolaasinivorans TaxID=76635 RepID=A0A3L7A7W9_9MICO|nr:alpha/beta hydrolase [Mycetocola tolaasinivorans]RLP75691.1 alpha/beta hydrolase [Mycetocola tolaasinivorans]